MERHHWEVWLIAAIGLWVIISPHALAVPFTDETRAGAFRWSFVGPGCFVALLAISAIGRFYAWEAVAAAALGAWLILSPWIVGFAGFPLALWSAVVPGAAIVGLGLWSVVTTMSDRIRG